MITAEQELTLFGGWAKVQIAQPIGHGADKPSDMPFSSVVSIETATPQLARTEEEEAISYHGVPYQQIAHVRWAVFFETLGSPFTYGPMRFLFDEVQEEYVFWIRFRNDLLLVTGGEPRGRALSRLIELVRQSSRTGLVVVYGPRWARDLRVYQALVLKRHLSVTASDGPQSTVITEALPIAGYPVFSLAQTFGLSLWIIGGKLYLYADGRIAHHTHADEMFSQVLVSRGKALSRTDPHVGALRAILPKLERELPPELKTGSYFLKAKDAFTVESASALRTGIFPHLAVLDWFLLPNLARDVATLHAAYAEAFAVSCRGVRAQSAYEEVL